MNQSEKLRLRVEIDKLILDIFRSEIEERQTYYSRELTHLTESTDKIKNPVFRKKEFQYRKKKLDAQYQYFDFEKIKVELQDMLGKKKDRTFFLWDVYFADVFNNGGFDIVIGNPPYVELTKNKSPFEGLNNHPIFKGSMNLWYFFGWLAIEKAKKESGVIGFIASNNWNTNSGASKFRNYILDHAKFVEYINFGDFKVFESANIQTMIYVMKLTSNNLNYTFPCSKLLEKKFSPEEIKSFLDKCKDDRFEHFETRIEKSRFYNKFIHFNRIEIIDISTELSKKGDFYLDKSEVTQGIVAPQDKVNKKSLKILGEGFSLNDGIFVLSSKELSDLNLSLEEKKMVKPLYTSKELERYSGNPKNQYWIIYTTSKFKEKCSMDKFPKIKAHLDRFQSVITSVNKPYGLNAAKQEKFFNGEKILSLRKCPKNPMFTHTDFPTYVVQTYYVIQTNRLNLKFLTCLLNSKLIEFWLKYNGKMQGSQFQVDKTPLLEVPIKIPPETEVYETLYDKISSSRIEIKRLKSDVVAWIYSSSKINISIKQLDYLEFDNEYELDKIISRNNIQMKFGKDGSQWSDYITTIFKRIDLSETIILETQEEIENYIFSLYEFDRTKLNKFI